MCIRDSLFAVHLDHRLDNQVVFPLNAVPMDIERDLDSRVFFQIPFDRFGAAFIRAVVGAVSYTHLQPAGQTDFLPRETP